MLGSRLRGNDEELRSGCIQHFRRPEFPPTWEWPEMRPKRKSILVNALRRFPPDTFTILQKIFKDHLIIGSGWRTAPPCCEILSSQKCGQNR